jgi:hypothetical protein
MTRAEADRRCTELHAAAADPDVRWMSRETSSGTWTVVRVRMPGLPLTAVTGTGQESRPRIEAPDPRPLVDPNWPLPG